MGWANWAKIIGGAGLTATGFGAYGIPLAAAGVGGAFADKSSSSTSSTLNPEYGPLQQMLLQRIMQRLQTPGGLPANYETGGIANINNAYGLTEQNLSNQLTARGLSTSPIAGTALAQSQRARAGDVGDFRSNIPLVQRQMENDDLNLASQFLNFGRGTSTEGSQGGGVGGAFDSMATMLGYLYGRRGIDNRLPGGGSGGMSGLKSSMLPGYTTGPFG